MGLGASILPAVAGTVAQQGVGHLLAPDQPEQTAVLPAPGGDAAPDPAAQLGMIDTGGIQQELLQALLGMAIQNWAGVGSGQPGAAPDAHQQAPQNPAI